MKKFKPGTYTLKYVGAMICSALVLSCNPVPVVQKYVVIDSNTTMAYEYQGNRLLFEKKIMVYNNDTGGYIKKFYSNGRLAKQVHFFKNKPAGNQFEYYENGKERAVNIIFADGIKAFDMQLNDDGSIKSSQGIPLHLTRPKNPIKQYDTVIFIYHVIMSPNLNTKLNVRMINPKGKEVSNVNVDDFVIEKHESYIERSYFKNTGNYINIVNIELYNKNKLLLKSQLVDTVVVVE